MIHMVLSSMATPRFVDTTGCMPARRSHFWDRDNHPIAQLTIPPPFMAGDRDSRRGTAEDGLCRSFCSGAGCSRSAGSRRGCADSRLALSADCGSLPSSPVVAERQHISACGATNLAVKLSIVNTACNVAIFQGVSAAASSPMLHIHVYRSTIWLS